MKAEEFKKQLNINLDAILKNVYNHRIGISEAYLLIMEDIKQYADEQSREEAIEFASFTWILDDDDFTDKTPYEIFNEWKSNQEEQL